MRKSDDIERAIDTFGSTVWRVCVTFFRHNHDAQDAFQETFLKYALAEETDFQDDEHRKAWLIKVSSNVCRDMLRGRIEKTIRSIRKPRVHAASFLWMKTQKNHDI